MSNKGIEDALAGIPEIETDEVPTDLDLVREELGIGDSVDPLEALLGSTTELTQQVKIKRLNAYFTVQAIQDDKEYDLLVERCTTYTKSRRGGNRQREVDGRRLARLTVATYCIVPPFNPKNGAEDFEKMAAKYGTREPEDLVDRALLLGEIDLLADTILTISGFDDEVTTAGN